MSRLNMLNSVQPAQKHWRQALPQQILPWLPLSLFFPLAFMYTALLAYFAALLVSGGFKEKWTTMRSSPLLIPVLLLSVVSGLISVLHPHPAGEFSSAFLHYQTYLFLFPLLALGAGAWQQRAIHCFFGGALLASTFFYLHALGLLPEHQLFRSYTLYEGNKSILLGLLLALAAGWMLHEWRIKKDLQVWRALAFGYVVVALVLMTKSRTAICLFLLLCALFACRQFRFKLWQNLAVVGMSLALAVGFYQLAQQPAPPSCFAKEMRETYQLNGAQIVVNRAICTAQQVRDFGQKKQVSEDGMRLEIYQNTWEMIVESPWLGHGIGNWLSAYKVKAQGQISAKMTTPHNDYLLYFFELGIFGFLALLGILFSQLRLAKRMMTGEYSERAMLLSMLTVTMMFAGLFNAILRDGVFGLAMMILLAIPLAGVRR